MVSGVIMVSIGGTLQRMFFIPFFVASVCGLISSLVMLRVKERKNNKNSGLNKRFTSEMLDIIVCARKSPDFMKYSMAGAVFGFFMAFSWPLFAITLIDVLNASMLEIALLSVVQSMITIIFQRWAGRLADTRGRKPLIVLFRFSLVTVPLAYAFAPNVYVLIAFGAFWGISMAMGQASMTAYLLDVTPKEYRGSFTAFYNLLMGVVFFSSSLISGYLSDYTIGLFGLVSGLQIVYMISTVGRGIGAATYLKLRETLKKGKTR